MSHNASKWVWDQLDIIGSEKLVLLRLADHADPVGGSVRPGLASVAQYTGLSPRQVARYIKGFVKAGILVIEANEKGGRGRIPEYRFTFQKGDTHDAHSSIEKGDTSDAQKEPKRVPPTTPINAQRVTPTVIKGDMEGQQRVTPTVISDTDSFKEPSIEPSRTVIGAREATPPKRATAIPSDFSLSKSLKAFGEREGFSIAVMESQIPQFVDNYLATGEARKDWDASFRKWMRNAKSWGHLSPNLTHIQARAPNGAAVDAAEASRIAWRRKNGLIPDEAETDIIDVKGVAQ